MHLRLMSYNIYEGGIGREHDILAIVKEAEPDVLFMQEVVHRSHAQYFAERLGMSFYFAESNAQTRNIALFSRYPIVRREDFHPFALFRTLLLATIALPNAQTLNLFGVHLALIHDLWRTYEIKVILSRIRSYEEANPTSLSLIAGDFNSVAKGDKVTYKDLPFYYKTVLALLFTRFPRFALAQLRDAGYTDCFRACHPHANGFSVPTFAPNIRLDYIFANSALANHLQSSQVIYEPNHITRRASDHYPLIADFTW